MVTVKKYGLKIYNWKTDKIPDAAVFVGRPTTYANPWSHVKGLGLHKAKNAADAVMQYRKYTEHNTGVGEMARRYLKGKNLVCDCVDSNCHAIVVMELANEPAPPTHPMVQEYVKKRKD